MGNAYDEIDLMAMVFENAYAIRELTPSPLPTPEPPLLLPVSGNAALSWRGSVGAAAYDVERATGLDGPWSMIGQGVMEDAVQYGPLFVDQTIPGSSVYYRVRARNASGVSQPSNVVGPVQATGQTFVDELDDFERVHSRSGDWQMESRDCRQAKEDAHRAAGRPGSALVYQLPAAIKAVRVFAFFPNVILAPKISTSTVIGEFQLVPTRQHSYFDGAGDYGYWKPVEYRVSEVPSDARLVRIELGGDTQIGRIEIDHDFE